MPANDVFDLGRVDPFAAGLDQVFRSAAKGEVAGVVDAGEVTSVKVTLGVNGVDLGQRGCDGILISTPAGSTGYNLSAGGSVIEWGVDAVVVTFVAPHSLDGRPLILGRGHEVRIVSRTRDVGSRVVVDGHAQAHLGKGETAVIRMAPETARLAILPDRPFLSRYRDKFGH